MGPDGVKRSTVENYLRRIVTRYQRRFMRELSIGIPDDEWISSKEASRRIDARLVELRRRKPRKGTRSKGSWAIGSTSLGAG